MQNFTFFISLNLIHFLTEKIASLLCCLFVISAEAAVLRSLHFLTSWYSLIRNSAEIYNHALLWSQKEFDWSTKGLEGEIVAHFYFDGYIFLR